MIGLAHNPGTEVDPTCRTARALSPSAATTVSRTCANCSGQDASGGTTSTNDRSVGATRAWAIASSVGGS